jgi:uncharacterized protein YndB with AHSA1/START domain
MLGSSAPKVLLMMSTLVVASFLHSAPVHSDVVYAEMQGFEVLAQVEVALPADAVYDSLINDVGQWWSSSHTFYGEQNNLTISAAVGGCFCEIKDKNQQSIHLEVIHVDTGKLIRFSGGLGPLQSMPVIGVMDWQVKSTTDSSHLTHTNQHLTNITFRYKVSGYVKGGLQNIAVPVDRVLQQQLESFKQFIQAQTNIQTQTNIQAQKPQ